MVTTNLCFTQLSIGHLKHDLSCFHGKALECYLPPDEDLQVSIIPYEGHLPSYPPMYYHLNFSYADVQFDKNAYPEMGKF